MSRLETITHAELKAVLRYYPHSGRFWWLKAKAGRQRSKPVGSPKEVASYLQIMISGVSYLAHRLAWFYMTGEWPSDEVDHEDRNKQNTAWKNLRPATHKQNSENVAVRKHSKSQIKGVHYDRKRRTWQAYIDHEGKRRHLGRHPTSDLATAARKSAEADYFTHAP